jgi:hypothetical protein
MERGAFDIATEQKKQEQQWQARAAETMKHEW